MRYEAGLQISPQRCSRINRQHLNALELHIPQEGKLERQRAVRKASSDRATECIHDELHRGTELGQNVQGKEKRVLWRCS